MERLTSTTLLADNFMDTRDDITEQLSMIWSQVKAPLIVPLLKLAVLLCLLMSAMLFVERVYMGVVILLVKLFGRKPDKRYKWEPLKDDVELGNSNYPMVLVQIPMYNEKEVIFFSLSFSYSSFIHSFSHTHIFKQVYQLSIGAACGLSWPSDRIIIQVLDDSTDPIVKVKAFFWFFSFSWIYMINK